MCGRYVSPDQSAIERAWRLRRMNPLAFVRRFNVAPTDPVPLLALEDGELTLHSARWGLIPGWWREEKPPRLSFNARVEESAKKPMWRDAMRFGRCLVPAEGWYEWCTHEQVDPATGEVVKTKQPHYIRRRDARLTCFAGLAVRRQNAEPALTCAILTAPSDGPIATLHDRMPISLAEEAQQAWLDPSMKDAERASALAREGARPEELVHYPVRKLVNSTRNDGPELIEPLQSSA
jgi:putative SOS response-associated peptidase YedK